MRRNKVVKLCSLLSLSILYIFQPSNLRAQEAEDSLVWSKTIIPVAFYLPETSLAGGASGIFTFKKASAPKKERPSQILFAAIATLKKQVEFICVYEIYKSQRKHRFKGELGYYRYFYNYYGIGSDSRAEDREVYNVNFPRAHFSYARRLYKAFNLGIGYKMDRFDIYERKEGGLLDVTRPIGWEGGFKSNVMALFFVDTRDNINAPNRGVYAELTAEHSLGWFYSDFDYLKMDIDLRYFTDLKNDWVLGHQLWITHTTSGTPFYDLAHISTASRSRGFDDRRFINYSLATLQSELRFPIKGRFRASAFYSYNVMPDKWSNLFANEEFLTYGIGLRYILNAENRTNVRLDIARGDGKINFYLTANEAF